MICIQISTYFFSRYKSRIQLLTANDDNKNPRNTGNLILMTDFDKAKIGKIASENALRKIEREVLQIRSTFLWNCIVYEMVTWNN